MIRTGIIGGAGYTAGELIRILVNHPNVQIQWVHSTSNAGKAITSVHQGLAGDIDMLFTEAIDYSQVNLVFFCMAHGDSKLFMQANAVPASVKIIDLSNDFRLFGDHDFVYGLPELNRELIKKSARIANPGCFATGIQLGLLPLAAAGLLEDEIHINGITGSTGAGQKPVASTHFSWRNSNVSVYKAFTHQHLGEIGQSLNQLQNSFDKDINFVPVRGNFARGILITEYTRCEITQDALRTLYCEYYASHPFVHVVDKAPDLKDVVNTNKCFVHVEKHGNKALITTVSDNLLKGASGQAVQNMNLIFGLEETTGLRLKAVAF